MNEELQEKLFKRYPKIFKQKDLPADQTCMCWGIDVGDGWYTLLDILCRDIQNHIDQMKRMHDHQKAKLDPESTALENYPYVEQVEAVQVKEKFGGLRFYYQGGDDYIRGLVDMTESMSYRTCELCGKPGRNTKGGWINTFCPEHAAEKNVELDYSEDEDE